MKSPGDDLISRVAALGLVGVASRWETYRDASWLPDLLDHEEAARRARSLERRLRAARIGPFKLLADFDWAWPKKIDRSRVEELMASTFVAAGTNVVLVGPNGVGKTLIAQNLAHRAVLDGRTVLFGAASEVLSALTSQESAVGLQRRLKRYVRPELLVLDEVGYLSYDSRHADLLFQIVSQRCKDQRATIVTTNRPFAEWPEVFPNAASVVALVDRLIQNSEVLEISGESYRLKEANERKARKAEARAGRRREASNKR